MTSVREIYEAFLSRITADEWTVEEDIEIVERDWRMLLNNAIFRFKYPRVSLEIEGSETEQYFVDDLTQDEIQLLALYMKHEWIKRCVASWENIRQLYADSNFSQANHLDKLNNLQEAVALEIHKAEGIYDRSRQKRPANLFKKLAGKQNV